MRTYTSEKLRKLPNFADNYKLSTNRPTHYTYGIFEEWDVSLEKKHLILVPILITIRIQEFLPNFPAWWQATCFQSEYPLEPILPGLRAEGHTGRFGPGDHFRSGYFRFRWVQEGGAGRRHNNRLASGYNKIRFFHMESADFNSKYRLPNYTENWKLRLT